MVLKTGGYASGASGAPPTLVNEIEVVREDGTNTVCAPMQVPRLQHNLTVLPNGKVLITGGTCGTDILANAVYATELWDPSAPTTAPVRLADAQQGPAQGPHRARTYHSTALLLPDERVISAGGETCVAINPETGQCSEEVDCGNADYFYPPYLFNGNNLIQDSDRPRITSGLPQPPHSLFIATGSTFACSVSSGGVGTTLQKACLIRPSAVTHAFNQEQRYVPLLFTPTTGGTLQRTVTAPGKAETAPPGYYLLFFLNDLGYPSIGEFVRVWGIVETSIVHGTLQVLLGNSLSLPIDWDTSIGADDIDKVLFWRRATATGPFDPTPVTVTCTTCESDANRHHSNTWQWPCEPGYWYYQVQTSESNTTSTNAAKIFIARVAYCID